MPWKSVSRNSGEVTVSDVIYSLKRWFVIIHERGLYDVLSVCKTCHLITLILTVVISSRVNLFHIFFRRKGERYLRHRSSSNESSYEGRELHWSVPASICWLPRRCMLSHQSSRDLFVDIKNNWVLIFHDALHQQCIWDILNGTF